MNAEQREILRTQLALLGAKYPAGFTLTSALTVLAVVGFAEGREAVALEVGYLADKGFLKSAAKAVSPENKRWQITAAGRDWLAEQGLA